MTFHLVHCLIFSFSIEKKLEVSVERAYASRYVTSQEMAGLSITLMLLDNLRLQCLGLNLYSCHIN